MVTVALQTNCWHRDWRMALRGPRLAQLTERSVFRFAERTLLINALSNYDGALQLAGKAIDSGVLTQAVVVEQHADAALAAVGLSRADLAGSYGYSIAELVGLHLTRCDYVLYFMSDCLPETITDWIPGALALMQAEPRIKVSNLLWNGNADEARAEADWETEDFFVGSGFSDQCYLVQAEEFRAPIYGFSHPGSERYPDYVQQGFERRIDSWMRQHGYLRATFKHASYRHANLPRPLGSRVAGRLRALAGGWSRRLKGQQ